VVANRAGVAVVALPIHLNILARPLGRATIHRTFILIVALQGRTGLAEPALAVVINGTGVAIGAATIRSRVHATLLGQAHICSTRILVIAVRRARPLAHSAQADVQFGARITIITLPVSGLKEAALPRHTTIHCADVAITADLGFTADARSVHTTIQRRTGIAIVTAVRIGNIHTPALGIARIVGTNLVVVAKRRHPGQTSPLYALVTYRASITIVTGEAGMVRLNTTLPRRAVTNSLGANRFWSFEERAHYNSLLSHFAEIGQT
jgi:hypothetical protein